ncbi:MAG TPA: hypothetical protein VNI02_08190 [Blastocatellia bacterium]|jgi:hypothetical protein|nr:hypothetical protein [Blastocatellia bacterium]
MKRQPPANKQKGSRAELAGIAEARQWESVSDIPGFPFETFDQLQAAVAVRSFNIGVDPLAAAEWSDRFNSRIKRASVLALSVLLTAAAAAALAAAIVTGQYWLLAALPVEAAAFYVSHPASTLSKWVTAGGAASVAVFINLLLNQAPIAATVVAYAGLTFAAVRAAGHITNSSFRKALASDEELFVAAYANGACTVRNNNTERVYAA